MVYRNIFCWNVWLYCDLSANYRRFMLSSTLIDELGYVPFSRSGVQLLFELFSSRYERGSIIITSNLSFANWTEVFQDERLTGTLLDRVTHHCHIIQIKGESFRFRQSLTKYELSLKGEKLAKEKQTVSS